MGNTKKQSVIFPEAKYRVAEIFESIQGEGYWTGVPATFIRLQGCPVHCSWCDSQYTWGEGGSTVSVEEIIETVKKRTSQHVIITGGEPLIQNLDILMANLLQRGLFVQIETSGYSWFKGKVRPSWITVSPKEALKYKVPVEFYRYAQEFKYVIDDNIEWETLWNSWKFSLLERVTGQAWPYFSLMPEGCPPREEMVDKTLKLLKCVPSALTRNWRFSDRMQWRLEIP